MRYIRRVAVEAPRTRDEHIVAIQYSVGPTGWLTQQSRSEAVRDLDNRIDSYRTHNDRTGAEAPVITAVRSRGFRYLTTVPDGRQDNNLLALPPIR